MIIMKKTQKKKKKDEDYNINENGQISNKLFDIIEIEEKNLILASFSKYHYQGYDDEDYTFSKCIILIIDIKNCQLNANILKKNYSILEIMNYIHLTFLNFVN